MKAHISVSDCEGSQDLLWKRAGNEVADVGAKAGAALHPVDASTLSCLADSDKVIFELAQYMGNVAAYRWRLYKECFAKARAERAEAAPPPAGMAAGRPRRGSLAMGIA